MIVTVNRTEKESNERLIARFNKKVQASRKLNEIRSSRYETKKPKKHYVRNAAIMREKYRAQRERKSFYY